jgi:autotransporter-associated beta strand protein
MKTPDRSIFSFLFSLVLLGTPAAFAQNTTAWTGNSSSTWSTAGNWGGGVPSASISALFNGTFTNQPTLGAAQTTQGIWLASSVGQDVTINSATAQVLTITGNATLNSQANAGIYMNDSGNHNLTIGSNTSIFLTTSTGFYNQQAGGTLTVSGGINLNGKNLTIGAGATSTGNVTITGAISSASAGGVIANSGGTVTLSGNNSYANPTSLTGGTLVLSGTNSSAGTTSVGTGTLQLANNTDNNGGLASGLLTLGSSGILQVTNASALAISNAVILTGSGVSVSGSQSLTINGTFTNAGTTGRTLSNNITAGTLTLAGPVYLSNDPATAKTLTLSGLGSTTVNGVISNASVGGLAGGLGTAGGGTITLTGNNTYTGATAVGAGTLILNGTGTSVTTAVNAGATFILNGTMNNSTSISVTSSTSVFNESSTGVISSGSFTITTTGGIATLAGNNTYAGGTTLTSATLNINSATALGTGKLTINGGTIDNTSAAAVTLTNNNAQAWNGNFAFTGTKDLNLGAGAVTMNASRTVTVNGGNLTVGGIISGPTFGLTKAGAGTLVLSGTNTYNGATAINAGTLQFANSDAGNSTSNVTVSNSGSTLAVSYGGGSDYTQAQVVTLLAKTTFGATSTSFAFNTTNGDGTYSNALAMSAVLTKLGANTLTLSGTNTYTGGTTISGGVLNLGSVQPLGGNGTLTSVGTIKFTGGTLQFSAANTTDYSSRFSGSAGQAFKFDTNGQNVNEGTALASTGGSLTKLGAGTLTVTTGTSTYDGATTISGGTLNVGTLAAVNTRSSIGNGTAGGSAADLVFDGGTLQYNGSAAQTTNRLFTVTANGGSIDASGSNNANPLTFTGTGALGASGTGARTLTITGSNTGNNSLAGILADPSSGATSLTKSGTGKWVLSGANTYTGATLVTTGTLIVNGSTASGSALTVSGGAVLGGTGTIGGATTISGTHSPGNSPGIQTFGSSLAYTGGSSAVVWELSANTTTNTANPTATFDQIIIGGNLDFTGTTTLTLSFNPASGSSVLWSDTFWSTSKTGASGWLVYQVAGTTTNISNLTVASANWLDSGSNAFNTAHPGANFSISQVGQNVYLDYNVVPEPATWALLAFSLTTVMVLRRRRNS